MHLECYPFNALPLLGKVAPTVALLPSDTHEFFMSLLLRLSQLSPTASALNIPFYHSKLHLISCLLRALSLGSSIRIFTVFQTTHSPVSYCHWHNRKLKCQICNMALVKKRKMISLFLLGVMICYGGFCPSGSVSF